MLGLAVAATGSAAAQALPVYSPDGPDAAAYGAAQAYPNGPRTSLLPQWAMVGGYSHFDAKYAYHPVAKAASASPLRRADRELTLSYHYRGGVYSLADYLDRNPATGLLIARGDTILFEHYRYARTDRDRLLSQSMAKTITSLLIGIAVAEGAIRSIDEPAASYVPALAGSVLG